LRQKIKGAGRQPEKDMARIYVSESGRDKNDGPTKQMPIYSWKRARKISGHIEITVDSAATRKRLVKTFRRSETVSHHSTLDGETLPWPRHRKSF
jgi:hypothetical protein